MIVRKRTARVAAVLATAGVAVASLVAGVGAADAARLPGAHLSKKVPGGSVGIRLFDESYTVQRAVTNTPLSREVWVSGKVKVTTKGAVEGGTVTTGYLIGCQLNFGANMGAKGKGGITTDQLTNGVTSITELIDTKTSKTNINGGFAIGPGQAMFVPIIKTTIDGTTVNSFTFKDPRGGVAYSQERFGVDGCAGFAQARALVNVQVSSDDYKGNITLFGAPFSLG
ncbi:MspA family porin [Gordonia sp. PP30]|uniref:MspA family porin n=1 Tax=Gordonia sp. PP30 TaxID=2935861 RepID=UPI0020005372|nr:MspA family porin [Gordonia sp. PP30]UQE75864.1 MspA family porin [Gordonia sp. PP30]